MTLKDLYKQTKNQQPNTGAYMGALIMWLALWAFYIVVICLGWNFIANIFKLPQLTYFQTGIIIIWSYFVRGLYTNGKTREY
jgi:hypothetical protein